MVGCSMYGLFLSVVWVPVLVDLSSQVGKRSEIYATSVIVLVPVDRGQAHQCFPHLILQLFGKTEISEGF